MTDSDGADTIKADDGPNRLSAGFVAAAEAVYGHGGDDYLSGGGQDSFGDGGSGFDTCVNFGTETHCDATE